jgi:hypothetical protein
LVAVVGSWLLEDLLLTIVEVVVVVVVGSGLMRDLLVTMVTVNRSGLL